MDISNQLLLPAVFISTVCFAWYVRYRVTTALKRDVSPSRLLIFSNRIFKILFPLSLLLIPLSVFLHYFTQIMTFLGGGFTAMVLISSPLFIVFFLLTLLLVPIIIILGTVAIFSVDSSQKKTVSTAK